MAAAPVFAQPVYSAPQPVAAPIMAQAPPSIAPVFIQQPAAPAAAPTGGRKRYRIVYDHVRQAEDEITVKPGDIVTVIREDSADWWTGEVNGAVGLFPTVMIDPVPLPGSQAPATGPGR